MTLARYGQAAARLHDGRVLILGGSFPFTGTCHMACVTPTTASVEIYNPGIGEFSANGSLAQPRFSGQALLLNDGRILVSGGSDNSFLNTIEIYDPSNGTSIVVKPPAALPSEATVVLLDDGRVLIAGGSYNLMSSSAVTLIFDPATGVFSNGPLMAEPREGATATLLGDGRVLIVGGEDVEGGYGKPDDYAELIDPSHPLSPSILVQTSQYPQTSTVLSDGRVLVTEYGNDREVSELFDPRTEKSSPVGPMSTPRLGSPTTIRIPDGRVLVFGGIDAQHKTVTTVEAFDPDTDTFQVVATGFPDIQGFSATLLDDGEILIVGGSGADWNSVTAATWLLKP
jgi:hypothetical protein